MKILEIQSCEECFNRKSCGNHWFCGVTNSNILGSTIPDWCPLPDHHLTSAMHSDGQSDAADEIWTNEDESAEIGRQITEDARR